MNEENLCEINIHYFIEPISHCMKCGVPSPDHPDAVSDEQSEESSAQPLTKHRKSKDFSNA